jgi:hypothetical protein
MALRTSRQTRSWLLKKGKGHEGSISIILM